MSSSPHFSRGHIPLAFVFSAPGKLELHDGRPVAGETGRNLELALAHLHFLQPAMFPSCHRYDYRITNAISTPLAIALGDHTSEARNADIRAPSNVQRVVGELEGCDLVVLCGNKARVLASAIRRSGMSVVEVPHVGNKALNRKFKVPDSLKLHSPLARREHRVRLWTDAHIQAIAGAEADRRA